MTLCTVGGHCSHPQSVLSEFLSSGSTHSHRADPHHLIFLRGASTLEASFSQAAVPKERRRSVATLSVARRKNKSIPSSVEPSRSGSSRCLETKHSPLHCSGMEFLSSLIFGDAHRLYGRGQVMMAAFHNLPDTHPTRCFVVLPSVHADRKGMQRNMQCAQVKDGLAAPGKKNKSYF